MNASKPPPPPLLFLVDCFESPMGGSYYSDGTSAGLGGAAAGNFFLPAGEALDLFIYIIVYKIELLIIRVY